MTDMGRIPGEPQPPPTGPASASPQAPPVGPASAVPQTASAVPQTAPVGPASAAPQPAPAAPQAPAAAASTPVVTPAAPRSAATEISVEQAIALRDQAPEMYELWLRIAQEKAATASYVERAPYEVPERLAQAGRPRALGALVIVLSFCGYLAWLGGPGPYIGGLIAILDLGIMFGMFFGLRPERLPDAGKLPHRR
jgi:hypothetical protein